MRQNLFIPLAVFFLTISLIQEVSSAQRVYIATTGAVLKAAANSTAQTVVELPIGTELSVLASEKKWMRVRTANGTEGWIYRGKISNVAPQKADGGGGSIGNLLGDLSGSSIQADSADASRSIRGLSPEAKEYAKQTGTSAEQQRALDGVLEMKVGKADIEHFLRKGKIGEYAD